jgi:hypothetical protein
MSSTIPEKNLTAMSFRRHLCAKTPYILNKPNKSNNLQADVSLQAMT